MKTSKLTIAVSLSVGILLGCGAKNLATRANAHDPTSEVPRVAAGVLPAGEVVQCQVVGPCVQYVVQRNLARGFGEWQVFGVAGQSVGTMPGGEVASGTGNPAVVVDAVLPAVGSGQGKAFSISVSEP